MISRSPNRFKFQQESIQPGNQLDDYFEKVKNQHLTKFDDPSACVHNMEYDLLTTPWILEKVRSSESYAQNLYAAICNNDFTKREPWSLLKEEKWHCSWRYAGGIIADMRQKGDYIDWYCSGIRDTTPPSEEEWNSWTAEQQENWNTFSKFVPEATVTEEIENDLYNLGWIVTKGQ